MISILLPSRGRPDNLRRLHSSVAITSVNMPQFSLYADLDDPVTARVGEQLGMVVTTGPRIVMSHMWNLAQRAASGDIFMLCGDDVIFRTPGWDLEVERQFAAVPDRILFLHGDDLSGHASVLGTLGFLHRRWVDTVGYFVPPIFSCDYCDTWQNWVADQLGRRLYLPDLVTEHMHPDFNKAELDQTHLERIARGQRDRVWDLWTDSLPQRQRDVDLLRAVMDSLDTNRFAQRYCGRQAAILWWHHARAARL